MMAYLQCLQISEHNSLVRHIAMAWSCNSLAIMSDKIQAYLHTYIYLYSTLTDMPNLENLQS